MQVDAMVEAAEEERKTGKPMSIMWFCELCDGTITDILSNFQKYQKMEIELKKIQTDIDNKLEAFDKRITKCEASDKQNITLAERVKQTEKKLTTTIPAIDIEEQRNIEKRKTNLILYGIPEPESTEIEDKLEEEFIHIQETYKQTINLTRPDIKDMFRLGKKNSENRQETEAKARPLLIKFHDEDAKLEVLKASSDLSLKLNNEKIKIYAANDLTQKQRGELKKLREELKTRKDRGEKDIGIRGDKVVKLKFFREQQANRSRVIWATHIKKKQQQNSKEAETEPDTS